MSTSCELDHLEVNLVKLKSQLNIFNEENCFENNFRKICPVANELITI